MTGGDGTGEEPDGEPDGEGDQVGRVERDGRGIARLGDGVGAGVRAVREGAGVVGTGLAGAVGDDAPEPAPEPPVLAVSLVWVGGRTEIHSASTARNSTVSTTVDVRGNPADSRPIVIRRPLTTRPPSIPSIPIPSA